MTKYKIRHKNGFTLAICPACGFRLWVGSHLEKLTEIRHISNPTIKHESHHELIFKIDGKTVKIQQYGACYLPSLYPLLNVPIETKIRAIIEHAEVLTEADSLLKIVDFRKHPFSFFDKAKTEVIT